MKRKLPIDPVFSLLVNFIKKSQEEVFLEKKHQDHIFSFEIRNKKFLSRKSESDF